MSAHATMVWRKLGPVVPRLVSHNVRRVNPGTRPTTPRLSVSVRVSAYFGRCARKRTRQQTCVYTVNSCTCKNGLPQTKLNCRVNGAADCASCNTGFMLTHARNVCIGTFSPVSIIHQQNQKKILPRDVNTICYILKQAANALKLHTFVMM